MAKVTFPRGPKASYSATTYADGIYFATDTHEIILNGAVYGVGTDVQITEAVWDTGSDTIIFKNADGDTVYSVTVPAASDTADGLLSKEDYAKLSGIEEGAQENVIETVQVNGTALEVSDKTVNVVIPDAVEYTGEGAIDVTDAKVSLVISGSDKVLTQSESGLLTNIGIDYYSTTSEKLVRLLGADGAVISTFDATAFVKDGMIESVELVHENEKGESGEFIKIVWNTDEGADTVYLDVTELVDVYTEGKGISITESESTSGAHEISVKIAGSQVDTGEGWDTNYLTLDEEGNLCAIGINAAIKEAVDEAVAEVEAEAISTVVEKDSGASHLTITSSKSGNETTYTIGEDDIASASDLSTLESTVSGLSDSVSDNSEAIKALEEDVSELKSETITVEGDNEHITVESSTDGSATTYKVSGSDIASASGLSTLESAVESLSETVSGNSESISSLESEVKSLEASQVTVQGDSANIHVTVTETSDNGVVYTIGESDIASADDLSSLTKLVGSQNDEAGTGTAFGAINQNAADIAELVEALTWIEVE